MRQHFTATSTVRAALLGIVAFGIGALFDAGSLGAVTIQPGDIIVSCLIDEPIPGVNNLGLVHINPITGERTVLSNPLVGVGPEMVVPLSVNYANGMLLVASRFSAPILVDPATGDRTKAVVPTAAFDTVEYQGKIYSVLATSVYESDPAALTTRVVSSRSVGSGVPLSSGLITVTANDGALYAISEPRERQFNNHVMHIDISTGNRRFVTGAENGSTTLLGTGPMPQGFSDVAVDHEGRLLAIGRDGLLLSVDKTSGDRTLLASLPVGNVFSYPRLALQENGNLFVGEGSKIWDVNPVTGEYRIVTANGYAGPNVDITGIMVVPNVPEPATVVMALLGCACLLAWRRGGRR